MKILDGQKGKRCSEAEYLTYTHKRCPKCKKAKLVSLFYRKKTKTARGWAWDSCCIDCQRAACRQYGSNNRQDRNSYLRAWRKKNPDAARKNDLRGRLKSKYNLTPQQLEQIKKKQKGKCAICGNKKKKLFIDHCHLSGRVRGLLCPPCNTFLGWYENKADHIVRFQKYLEQT